MNKTLNRMLIASGLSGTEETIDDANDDGHICIDQHLMKGSGCSDSLDRGSDVRESEKLLFQIY